MQDKRKGSPARDLAWEGC